jgi:flagellar protein FlgJ
MSLNALTDSKPTSVFDVNGLATIKRGLKTSDPKALKAAAQQFEALFLQMVLKSMRDATPHEGLFDSEQTRFYESMLDSQLSHVLSGKGGKNGLGLAEMIEKQLSRPQAAVDPVTELLPLHPPLRALPIPASGSRSLPLPTRDMPAGASPNSAISPPAGAQEFISRVWPQAIEAAQETGIAPHFLVAQAALETGWGRAEPRRADGSPSFNLFGIKAGRSWGGPSVDAVTTEFVDGQAHRQSEKFRAYGSYADAFRDYASLLKSNPRYAGVLAAQDASGFSRALQNSGYATDPRYGEKLYQVIGAVAGRLLSPS